MPVTVLTVLGTRPQLVKALPVTAALRAAGIHEIVVDTGQHYDHGMSEGLRIDLGLRSPDVLLGVGSGSHAAQTAHALELLEPLMVSHKPDMVLVYGDTNSTLAGALAAAKLGLPIGHIEAGLRSFNKKMPEETNRVVTDHVSTLLFAPTATAVRNLTAEGILEGVHLTGDVMLDAVLALKSRIDEAWSRLRQQGYESGKFILATVHRAETADQPDRWANVLEGLSAVAAQVAPVVWPVHPRTRRQLAGVQIPGVRMVEPLAYTALQAAAKHAKVVLTDSGGLQKEAAFHGTPCVTLRDETEWTELVEAGANRLSGTDAGRILCAALDAPERIAPLPRELFGDGTASETIAKVIAAHLKS